MQCPHNRLAAIKNLTYSFQRKHTLIYPREMDYVCFFELWELCNVHSCIGNINLKEMFSAEMRVPEDTPTLPKKIKLVA